MKEPEWVQRDTVLALQERLLAEFGGTAGIRDEGLLDSALSRPLNRFAYEKPTIFGLAANYAVGLVRNHPFVDGNKRIGFATADPFPARLVRQNELGFWRWCRRAGAGLCRVPRCRRRRRTSGKLGVGWDG